MIHNKTRLLGFNDMKKIINLSVVNGIINENTSIKAGVLQNINKKSALLACI
jgi:hypothetical protein